MKGGAHSRLTPDCVTLTESLPSLQPPFLSTADASIGLSRRPLPGDSPQACQLLFLFLPAEIPQADGTHSPGSDLCTAAQLRAMSTPPTNTHTVMGGRAGLLTVPELTYFFFFIFFLGFITYREKQLLFESIQGRFGAPTSPGCGLGTSLAGYGV